MGTHTILCNITSAIGEITKKQGGIHAVYLGQEQWYRVTFKDLEHCHGHGGLQEHRRDIVQPCHDVTGKWAWQVLAMHISNSMQAIPSILAVQRSVE